MMRPRPVRVRQTGNDARTPAIEDLRRIDIKNTIVVGLSIVCECLVDSRVRLEARRLQSGLHHAKSAGWENCAAEWPVCLKTSDDFIVPVDPAGLMAKDSRRCCRIDIQHTLVPFLFKIWL